jgi:hypothetical protein
MVGEGIDGDGFNLRVEAGGRRGVGSVWHVSNGCSRRIGRLCRC